MNHRRLVFSTRWGGKSAFSFTGLPVIPVRPYCGTAWLAGSRCGQHNAMHRNATAALPAVDRIRRPSFYQLKSNDC